jgi:hypothetical protein
MKSSQIKIENGEIIVTLSNGMTYSYCTLSRTEEVRVRGERVHYYKYPMNHIMPLTDFIAQCEQWEERNKSVMTTTDFFKNFNVILNIY